MRRISLAIFATCLATPALAAPLDAAPALTAAQIVDKNIAARGGLDAWRKVQTTIWVGHIESPNAPALNIPFALEQKRPDKTRFEIKMQNQLSVRMFDGSHGWKVRPGRDGHPDVQAFTPDELRFAEESQGIDGPLMDYQSEGITITLDGMEKVDGANAYRLSLLLPSGSRRHVWIDAQSFLDIKSDRKSQNASGAPGTVSKYYRDYRTVDGLRIPFIIESGSDTGRAADKMVIDKVVLNPPLQDRMFAEPFAPRRQNKALQVRNDTLGRMGRTTRPGQSRLQGPSSAYPASLAGSGHVQ
ncbi:MAG: hypothetical protein WBX11_02075 [Thiobacillaceae bacterium]